VTSRAYGQPTDIRHVPRTLDPDVIRDTDGLYSLCIQSLMMTASVILKWFLEAPRSKICSANCGGKPTPMSVIEIRLSFLLRLIGTHVVRILKETRPDVVDDAPGGRRLSGDSACEIDGVPIADQATEIDHVI
jgi:hypothetical protein